MQNLNPEVHTRPFQFFLATNKATLPLIVLRILFYSLGTLCTVGMAFYLGKVIDGIQGTPTELHRSSVLLIGALVLHEIAYRIGHVCEAVTHARIRARVKKVLFAYTSKLSFGYFADRFAGQLSHQINTAASSLEQMEEMMINKFIDNTWLFVVSAFAIGSLYSPLGVVMAVWLTLFLIGITFFARKLTMHAEAFAHQESNTTGTLVDMYSNVGTVKVYGKDFDRERLEMQVNKEYRSQLVLGKWSVFTYGYQGLSAVVLGITIFVVTAYGYRLGVVSIGGIAAISGIALRLIEYVYEVGHSISAFVRSRGECAQALKDIVVHPEIADGKEHANFSTTVAVTFNNVHFSYNQKRKVLHNFSLHIPIGQKLGIVGLSGAGKTTIVNLLLRFYEPQEGEILFNDIAISSFTQSFLRSHISHISQDTSLFHASVADNIAYGLSDVPFEDIQRAAAMAYADDFIQKLPNGYGTIVGERGVKLSGGQRQRIAIARAILKNAPLFLLDEATSALDSDSEAKVQDALKAAMEGKTVIAIAHRLSTLQFMDRIVFMEEGKIIEDGTHDELVTRNGKYAMLWNMQAGGFLPNHTKD